MGDRPRSRSEIIAFAVVFEAGLGALACVLGLVVGIEPGATLRADPVEAALGLAAVLPMLPAAWWCLRSTHPALVRIRKTIDGALLTLFEGCTLPELALVATAAGVGEELLFRGLAQGWLVGRLGPSTGLVLASMIFGLLHAVTPAYALIASLLGAYLGLVWIAAGGLLAPIVTHAAYDFLVLAYLLRLRPARSGASE